MRHSCPFVVLTPWVARPGLLQGSCSRAVKKSDSRSPHDCALHASGSSPVWCHTGPVARIKLSPVGVWLVSVGGLGGEPRCNAHRCRTPDAVGRGVLRTDGGLAARAGCRTL